MSELYDFDTWVEENAGDLKEAYADFLVDVKTDDSYLIDQDQDEGDWLMDKYEDYLFFHQDNEDS
jgi:hypothetical protein